MFCPFGHTIYIGKFINCNGDKGISFNINCKYILQLQLQHSMARTLTSTAKVLATPEATRTKQHNATTMESSGKQRTNETTVKGFPTETKPLELSIPATSKVLTHILRTKRETEVIMPFDFYTMHLPCDYDQQGKSGVLDSFPAHCLWIYKNRFSNEGFYRVFKSYQLEGFFFGQYYERMKRFEIDPHTWDYDETGID